MGNKDSRPADSPKTGIKIGELVPPNSLLIRDRTAVDNEATPNSKSRTSAAVEASSVHEPKRPLTHVVHDTVPQKAPETADVSEQLPILVRYTAKDAKARINQGQQMQVIFLRDNDNEGESVSASQKELYRKTVKMTASEDNFFAFVHLPPGVVNFIFLADNHEYLLDPSQPIINHPTIKKQVNTIASVNEILLQKKDDNDVINDPAGWGQEHTQFEETRKYPPIMPPHLRYTPLNTPPTQVRCAANGRMGTTYDGDTDHVYRGVRLDAEHLPLPLSVTINHVYVQRREDHTVTGITTRYIDKYTTIAYYSRREVAAF